MRRLIRNLQKALICVVLTSVVIPMDRCIAHADTFQNEPAPHFFLSNLNGKRFVSKRMECPFVVSFFFVNCRACLKEIPALYKMMSTRFSQIPLLFIDPVKTDSSAMIQRYAKKLDIPIKHFYKDSLGVVAQKFYKMHNSMTFPYLVGIQGNAYLFRHKGYDQQIAHEIQNLLTRVSQ